MFPAIELLTLAMEILRFDERTEQNPDRGLDRNPKDSDGGNS